MGAKKRNKAKKSSSKASAKPKKKSKKASKSKKSSKRPSRASKRISIKKTKHSSFLVGDFPKSCELSAEGKVLNLFVTGLSQRTHPYEVDDPRQITDNSWANELKVQNKKDIVDESKRSLAEAASITGGDPLTRMDRTTGFIKLLKKEYSDSFYVFLHTFLDSVTDLKLHRLADVKLDEIVFYPDLDNPRSWRKFGLARNFPWKIGMVVPAMPAFSDKIKKLLDHSQGLVDYIVFNDCNCSSVSPSSVKDSVFSLMKYAGKLGCAAYYFPSAKRQMIEMRNRLKLRASNSARSFDKVTSSGTLVRGAIYLQSMLPCEDYHIRLQTIKKNEYLKRLYRIKRELNMALKAKFGQIEVDRDNMRILADQNLLKKGAKKVKALNLVPALVEEYPTSDNAQAQIKYL